MSFEDLHEGILSLFAEAQERADLGWREGHSLTMRAERERARDRERYAALTPDQRRARADYMREYWRRRTAEERAAHARYVEERRRRIDSELRAQRAAYVITPAPKLVIDCAKCGARVETIAADRLPNHGCLSRRTAA